MRPFTARLTRPLTGEQLGLQLPGDPAGALRLTLGAASAVAALAAGCALAGTALAAVPAVHRPAAARRPELRGSAA